MSSKIYAEKDPDSRSCCTIENEMVSVIKRLKCGQDVDSNSCPCSVGQPAAVAALHHRSSQTAIPLFLCSSVASSINGNDYFEQWQNNELFEDDEHTDLFCMCRMVSDVDEHRLRGSAVIKPEPRPRSEEEVDTSLETVKKDEGNQTKNNSSSTPTVESEMILTETLPLASPAGEEKKRQKKKQHHKKKTACSTRTAGSDVSVDIDAVSEKCKNLIQLVYPGVNCGHKNCMPQPIVTPKNIGWLWSLKETGGVKINRNWRPGAIPRNVAVIMEKVRAGTIHDMSSHSIMPTVKKPVNVTKPLPAAKIDQQQNPTLNKPTSNQDLGTTPAVTKKQNATKPWLGKGEPVLSVNKHKDQYGIKMNPVSYRNSKGELVCPKNVEPVCIKLGRRAEVTLSSQSSMDLNLLPPYGFFEPK